RTCINAPLGRDTHQPGAKCDDALLGGAIEPKMCQSEIRSPKNGLRSIFRVLVAASPSLYIPTDRRVVTPGQLLKSSLSPWLHSTNRCSESNRSNSMSIADFSENARRMERIYLSTSTRFHVYVV